MIPTRLLRFLNRALQFLSDLQQSLNGENANEVLADLFSQYLANVYTESQVSACVSLSVYGVCMRGYTGRWRLAIGTPAISHAPASAELKCAGRSHAGFTTLSPPKQNTEVICNKRISCLLSPLFKRSLCIGNQLSLPSWTSCSVGSHGNEFWHCCAEALPL